MRSTALRDFAIEEDSPETPRHISDALRPIAEVPATRANPNTIGLTRSARSRAATIPKLVIQRIADFRAEDKPDPNYYARPHRHKGSSGLH